MHTYLSIYLTIYLYTHIDLSIYLSIYIYIYTHTHAYLSIYIYLYNLARETAPGSPEISIYIQIEPGPRVRDV